MITPVGNPRSSGVSAEGSGVGFRLHEHLEFLLVLLASSQLISPCLGLSMSAPAGTVATRATLGGPALRRAVLEAASADIGPSSSLDVNGIVWMEHINLVVGSRPVAEKFYLDFLGFTKDKSKSFHVNMGQQQLHLAETGDPSQRLTGSIGLVVPTLSTIRERAKEASQWFQDTKFAILSDEDGCISMVDPFGGLLHVYGVEDDDTTSATVTTPQKMTNMHAEGGIYAARMAVRCQPGIRYAEISCRPGTTKGVARFYREMLQCDVHQPESDKAVVTVGPGVHLVYAEDERLAEDDVKAMEGVHICIYVPNFKNLYDRLDKKGLIWSNPRFVHLDSCDTWEEAQASRTLRFKDIVDLETGEKIMALEHETRPLRHGQYMKVPYYVPR